MQFIENLRLALTSIAANKMRSVLTMLGIIIGISAVIMITTIGTSIQKTLVNTFNSIGNMNYFDVYAQVSYGLLDENGDEIIADYTDEDLLTRQMLDKLVDTYPDYFYLNLSDSFGGFELKNWKDQTFKASVIGRMSFEGDNDIKFIRGRRINKTDSDLKKQVVNVSTLFVKQYLPPDADPIGQTITTELGDFVIVGVFELPAIYTKQIYKPGQKDIEKVTPVYIPYDTGMKLTYQESSYDYYASIYYYPEYDVEMLENTLRDFFAEEYAEKPYMHVEIENMQTYLGMINTVINVVTIAISIIAAISLIVGGVGVMNIMLVSITERTKEIGVRKALGAQNSAIRMQFVVEAILLCLIGGIIGIILGIVGGMALGFIAKQLVMNFYAEYAELFTITIQPSIPAILISVGFSILTGVFFGYYPANKAAKMNPIDALRYD
ncbi:MAG: ABC transporter permease [Oscillospiraceae bacterium]|nr:ABC transporter permease [Oscillospiraceae bacterium]